MIDIVLLWLIRCTFVISLNGSSEIITTPSNDVLAPSIQICNPSSIHHQSIINPASIHHQSSIIPSSIHLQSTINPSSIHHQSSINPSSIHHQSIFNPVLTDGYEDKSEDSDVGGDVEDEVHEPAGTQSNRPSGVVPVVKGRQQRNEAAIKINIIINNLILLVI